MSAKTLCLGLTALILALATSVASAVELQGWVREAADYPQHQGLKFFFERLKINSNGKFDGKIHCCEEGGTQIVAAPKFMRGEYDVALLYTVPSAPLTDAVPEVGVLGLPFLFRSPEQMMQALDGKVGADVHQLLAAKGLNVLSWFDGGSRSFYSRNRLLQFASDFKGQKIRVPGTRPELVKMTQALGGITGTQAFDKLPDALKSGELDIAENDLTSYYISEHYKVAPYYTLSHHVVQPVALVVAPQTWAKLSEADRAAFQKSAAEAATQERRLRAEVDAQLIAKLQKLGVKFGEFKGSSTVISGMKEVYAPLLINQKATDLMLRVMTLK